MARSLNKVQLIGNLTRDPELRYTPNGKPVCSFGIATNRYWTTESGEKREEADFHNIVAWNKLAELCSQFLVKGRKVYVEGRLSTRSWTGQDGIQKSRTEIVIDDMILLDSKGGGGVAAGDDLEQRGAKETHKNKKAKKEEDQKGEESETKGKNAKETSPDDEVSPDDIPF